MTKRILKIAGFTITGIIIFLVLFFTLISSGIFNSLVATQISKSANKKINANLKIEKIEGNILGDFSVNNISIVQQNQEIITIDSVKIKYNLSKIIRKLIDIDLIDFNGIQLNLIEENDSVWNFQRLIPENINVKNDKVSSPFLWEVNLKQLFIQKLQAHITSLDSTNKIPQLIKLNAALFFSFSNATANAELHQFDLETQKPSVKINDFTFNASISDSVFIWDNFILQLSNSAVFSEGLIPFNQLQNSEISLKASPFDFADINEWISNIYGNPDINLAIKNEGIKSKLNFTLKKENQTVKILGDFANLNQIPSYNIILETDSLNGEYWTKNPDFKSNIKGKFTIDGEGLDFSKNEMNASAQFADLKYKGYELIDLLFSFEKTQKKLDATIHANTIFGKLDSKIKFDNLLNNPNYLGTINLKQFNLAKLTANKNLESNLNFEIQAKGTGFELGKMETDVKIKSINSTIFNQKITDININFALINYDYNIDNFVIETPYLQAKVSGRGNINGNNLLNFSLKAQNIEQTVVLLGLSPIQFNGEISGKLTGPAEKLNLSSQFQVKSVASNSIELKNTTGNISSSFSIHPDFVQNTNQQNEITQQFIDFKQVNFKTGAIIESASYRNYFWENIELDFEKIKNTANGNLIFDAAFGKLKTQFNIQELFNEPEYNLTGALQNVDISEFVNTDSLFTNLNLGIKISGKGIKPETLQSEIEIRSDNSFIYGMPLEDFNASFSVNRANYVLKGLLIETPFLYASASGKGNWKESNQIQFNLKTKDIQKLNSAFDIENLKFQSDVNGTITGGADSLNLSSIAYISNLNFDTVSIDRTVVEINIQRVYKSNSGDLNILLNDVGIQDFRIKQVELKSVFDSQKANNYFTYFANDSLNGTINSLVEFSDKPTFYFPDIDLNFYNNIWKNRNEDTYIRFGKDSIEINQFEIFTDESAILANGVFAFQGAEDLHLEIKNMNLIKIPGIQLLPYQFSGKINSNIALTGTAKNPKLVAKLNIDKFAVDSLKFNVFNTEIDYQNKNLKINSFLDDFTSRIISAQINIPLHFSLSDSIYIPQKDDTLTGNISIEKLDLKRFNKFIPLKETEAGGILNANIGIYNTLNNPQVNGWLDITKGAFSYKTPGIFYNDIQLHSRINKNNIILDSLRIRAGKGKLKMSGELEFESLKTGNIKNIDLRINGQNFRAFDSDMIRAVLNTNLTLKGTKEKPVFDGDLHIARSTLNTDIFLKEYYRVYNDSEEPLLVVAQKNANQIQFQKEIKIDTTQKPAPDIYKNLSGQFDVEIPRNTWIKGKNMNFELSGSMQAIKESEKIDFFGTLNVKRGFYKIYGRRLDFEDGELTFTGGQSLNPITNFNIAYKFRDPENTLKKLNVKITGRILKPEIAFFLNDESIEEKEAISYLLFNKSTNQLDAQEDASINSNLDVAKALAINQVSNVVKDVLQSSLGLDVIEISGKSGWTQGSVSIGKYITNNLFLNYERTFALDKKDKKIEPEKITLEYQFYRSLFLQATNQSSNSGFDFIIKWTWK